MTRILPPVIPFEVRQARTTESGVELCPMCLKHEATQSYYVLDKEYVLCPGDINLLERVAWAEERGVPVPTLDEWWAPGPVIEIEAYPHREPLRFHSLYQEAHNERREQAFERPGGLHDGPDPDCGTVHDPD